MTKLLGTIITNEIRHTILSTPTQQECIEVLILLQTYLVVEHNLQTMYLPKCI